MAESDSMTKPLVELAVGTVMLIVAFGGLSSIPGWADWFGAILVYMALFLFMSIAGRLFWSGADAVIGRLRNS